MNLHIVGVGKAATQDFPALQKRFQADSSFRKATRNMMMSYAALEGALAPLNDKASLEKASFVLGSSYGELEVTKEFLSTLDTQGLARPLLFQNSLHNATLGFLALKLGLRGPSVTVSHRHFTGENCLEVASLLLDTGSELCLVAAVDTRVEDLESAVALNYPKGISIGEGAAALLLATEDGASKLGLPTIAVIQSIQYSGPEFKETPQGRYYDSNALEKIADRVSGPISEATPESALPRELKLLKPNHTSSTIIFQ